MLIKTSTELFDSAVTPEAIYLQRRQFLQLGIAATASLLAPSLFAAANPFASATKSPLSTNEDLTPLDSVTSYNNFYEFGVDKTDPAQNAHTLITTPWTINIEGEVEKPGMISMEDLLKNFPLEERIYRLRCVEGWSMVIPWLGFPLSSLLKQFKPNSRAKYVQFISVDRPEQMIGQKQKVFEFPYQEGLRIDEAMNPLTLLSVGLYGKVLPNQNGAPIRLVVPWKYGFKSIKSIVTIRLVEKQPLTSWQKAVPNEYGFYSNVNPEVDHPRWSQKKERRIGEFFKRKTLMFNGYAEQVAILYNGMDLRKDY
jgi:sulfoxide reductase catalytic subunit YedY